MELNLELIQADIIASAKMLEEYKLNKRKSTKNISAYHLQQAVEKLIKFQIYRNATNCVGRNMYTHNILALIRYSQQLGLLINIPKYIALKAAIITTWEASSRYDYDFTVRIDSLEKIQKAVEEWYNYLYGLYS